MLDEYDRPAQIFTVLVSCLGVTANSILLVAIKTRSSPSFRVYSTILLNNAAVDLIASLFAAFTITRIASSHETFTTFLIFTGPCSYVGRLPCWIIHAIEVQMWITSNYFLCFAFAYRLMSIRKAPLLLIRVISIAFFIHVFNCLTATALFSLFLENNCTETDFMAIRPQYHSILKAKYEIGTIQFTTVRSIVDLVVILSSSPVIFTATIVFRQITVRTLRASRRFMSIATRNLNHQLVKTLNIQLSLTALFGIGCIVFMLQFMGFTQHPVTEVLPCAIVSLLPAIAPVFNLLFIRPYRIFAFSLITRKRTPSNASICMPSLSLNGIHSTASNGF